MAFERKVAWITGGGTGLGRALALELARQGADVALSGRRAERLDEVAEMVRSLGRRALSVPCDVTDSAQVDAAARQVVDVLGGLDIAVANAGFSVSGRVVEVELAQWQRQFDVNVLGLVRTIQAAMPHLEARGGQVVLVGSVSAFIATPNVGPYSASKAAVRAIGDSMWAELRRDRSRVSVTTIHPGFVQSEIGQVDNDGVFHSDWRDKRPAGLMWTSEAAGRVMVRAIRRRQRELIFTGHGKFAATIARWFPGLTARLVSGYG